MECLHLTNPFTLLKHFEHLNMVLLIFNSSFIDYFWLNFSTLKKFRSKSKIKIKTSKNWAKRRKMKKKKSNFPDHFLGLSEKWSTLDPKHFYAIPFQKLVFLISLYPEFLEKKPKEIKSWFLVSSRCFCFAFHANLMLCRMGKKKT